MRKYLAFLCLLLPLPALCQNLPAARQMLEKLTAETLWGRGYTNNGMEKAADLIVAEFKSYGLQPMDGKDFKQPFVLSINTFPGKMAAGINGQTLIPGKDFIVLPESVGKTVSGKLSQLDSVTFADRENKVLVLLANKLTWGASQELADFTGIRVDEKAIKSIPLEYSIDIENEFKPQFKATNLCGLVRGTRKPDSLIVITAHYDHLGGMGDNTYFPGANDNASGVTFLLSLAKHYAANPQPYSMGFICFGAEEPGLVGSKYFTEQPLVPLQNIRFLINLDMVGTGDTGITVVNASSHSQEFNLLNRINDEKRYLPRINSRGKTANSDHHFFSEKGVPAFFIYTQGGIRAYHDINDKAATLPFTEFKDLFKLFVDFNKSLMN